MVLPMSASILIAVIRDTNLLTNPLVDSWCSAMRVAVQRFAEDWVDADIEFVPPEGIVPNSTKERLVYQLWFKDHTDQDGSLGYHADNGEPVAYVFVADDLANGTLWTVTGSHELWEMLADPDINRTVTVGDIERPIEVCDCCEDDSLAWDVTGSDGVTHKISAWATPAWFDPAGVAPFTYPVIDAITAPFQLAEGGYIGERQLCPDGQWTMRLAEGIPSPRTVKAAGSRTMRRFEGRV